MEALAKLLRDDVSRKQKPQNSDTLMTQYKLALPREGAGRRRPSRRGEKAGAAARNFEQSECMDPTPSPTGQGHRIIHHAAAPDGRCAKFMKWRCWRNCATPGTRWKTIDTEQFRLLCAEYLPAIFPDPKLENFFDQWVYGTGIPTVKLTLLSQREAGGLINSPVPLPRQTCRKTSA